MVPLHLKTASHISCTSSMLQSVRTAPLLSPFLVCGRLHLSLRVTDFIVPLHLKTASHISCTSSMLHVQFCTAAFLSTFSRAWPFAFISTGLLISCVPASSENSFAQFLHFQYASCPVSVQPASFFSTFSRLWPFAFISTGLMISFVPASSENSFAQFLHLQYASYPIPVQSALSFLPF